MRSVVISENDVKIYVAMNMNSTVIGTTTAGDSVEIDEVQIKNGIEWLPVSLAGKKGYMPGTVHYKDTRETKLKCDLTVLSAVIAMAGILMVFFVIETDEIGKNCLFFIEGFLLLALGVLGIVLRAHPFYLVLGNLLYLSSLNSKRYLDRSGRGTC